MSKILAVLSLGILVVACSQQAPSTSTETNSLGPGEVATVDGQRIPESVFRLYTLATTQKNADDLTPEERQGLIDQLVYVLVLANAAESEGLPGERRIAAELEFQRWQTLARAMTERFRSENPPTEAELRALYEQNLSRLASTQYKARHILVDTEDEATAIIAELDNGADFDELARQHSTGPTGPDGGDLGWFSADSMVAPFAEAVRNAEIGTYTSEPVQTRFGWHVILVEDQREQEPPGLESVRDELTTAVERQKLDQYVGGLREAAEVVIN